MLFFSRASKNFRGFVFPLILSKMRTRSQNKKTSYLDEFSARSPPLVDISSDTEENDFDRKEKPSETDDDVMWVDDHENGEDKKEDDEIEIVLDTNWTNLARRPLRSESVASSKVVKKKSKTKWSPVTSVRIRGNTYVISVPDETWEDFLEKYGGDIPEGDKGERRRRQLWFAFKKLKMKEKKKKKLSITSSVAIPQPTSPSLSSDDPMIDSMEAAGKRMEDVAYQQIDTVKENFAVLIAGDKNVGKSTYCRELMNRFLERGLSVYHLECDPGQTEFTPPGCLALTEVVEKVKGLPLSHLRTPFSCKYFGASSPANRIGDYISCIQQLVADFQRVTNESCPACLVVNTCGWIQGTGLEALREIVRACNPNFVVMLGDDTNVNSSTLAKEAFDDIRLFVERDDDVKSECVYIHGDPVQRPGKMNPAEFREAALLAYFGHQIRDATPYVVPMKSVFVHFAHRFPPPAYSLSVINGSLIALCRLEKETVGEEQDLASSAEHWCDDPTMPLVFQGSVSSIQCLGFGIVRAIDIVSNVFYVVTPMPMEQLTKVNMFVKGDICLPSTVISSQTTVPDADANDDDVKVPYLVRKRLSQKVDAEQRVILKTLGDDMVLNLRERAHQKRPLPVMQRGKGAHSSEPSKKKGRVDGSELN